MRRLVLVLCALVIGGCGGGGGTTAMPPQNVTGGGSAQGPVSTPGPSGSTSPTPTAGPSGTVPPAAGTPSPTPRVTPSPTPSPTPGATPSPTATPTATPAPITPVSSATLYVGSAGEVDAFPAGSNGATVPQRRITGFFKPRVRPENISSSAVAIAVGADRVLYVVKDTQGSINECALIAESPNANGTGGVLSSISCGLRGSGVTAPSGEVDVLTTVGTSTNTVVQRFVNGNPTSRLPITGLPITLASGPNGNLFVSHDPGDPVTFANMGRIDEYAAGASDSAAPVRTITAPSGSFFGALAVAPNGTLYAVYTVPNYSTGRSTETIYAFAPGSTSASRTLGPFTNDLIAALAVNSAGELYVGSNACCRYAGSSSRVDVFAPTASGSATPVRTIPNPIPGDAQGGTSINEMALSP